MDFYGLLVILVFFLFIYPFMKLSKKTVKDESVDMPEEGSSAEDLEDLFRRLLEQNGENPIKKKVVEKKVKPCATPKPQKAMKNTRTQVKQATSKKQTEPVSSQQGLSIHTKGELRRAILYSEIIRRKY